MKKHKPTPMETENILIVLGALILALMLIIRLVVYFMDFQHELNYVNAEIRRTVGEERNYWRRQKRKLWFSILPFCHR